MEVAHVEKNYINNYQEVVNDDGTPKIFSFNITKPGKIYLGLEYYNPRMYPEGCHQYTTGQVTVMTPSGTILFSTTVDDGIRIGRLVRDNRSSSRLLLI